MTASPLSPNLSVLAHAAYVACHHLSTFTEVHGQINRTYLSPPMRDLHTALREWADRLGMQTRVDAAGNLRSRRECARPDAPTFYLGSHLDTVPNGGAYDGLLGVTLAYATAEALSGVDLPFHLEVLGFSEEEGVRYGVSFIGSRALVGTVEELLAVQDVSGQTVAEAIQAFGLNLADLPAARTAGPTLGYLEYHIEQGPVLQSQGAAVGIVSGIVGQDRLRLTFTGRASHAGTTPMHLRCDALAAAARFIVAAEDLARTVAGLVATVGMIEASPGAGNVIPGEVTCSLDIRHLDDEVRASALGTLLETAQREAQARGVTLEAVSLMSERASLMDPQLRQALHDSARSLDLVAPELPSGAGHDAQIMAQTMPAAMLFIRSPNALSHHPDEQADEDDVAAALALGVAFLRRLASGEVKHV